MDANTPDLTGEDPEYFVSTYQRTVFRAAQELPFDVPVFDNHNFEVTLLGATNQLLARDVDYTVYNNNINVDAMSVCKEIDPLFNTTLLKGITMIRIPAPSYRVQVKFNQLFPDEVSYASINSARDIEVTPTLIANMAEKIEYLQQMVLDDSSSYSQQSALIRILDPDPNGQSPTHLILDEIHDINTVSGVAYIRPMYGAFFKDSVVIKNGTTDVAFDNNAFEIIDVDLSCTRVTNNHSGVFQTIHILTPYVGAVKVSYRAYGGVTDVGSVRNISSRLEVVEEYLASTSYITPATLKANPTLVAIQNRIMGMASEMRLLLQNGLPSYGDVSTGSAVVKRITASDVNRHWWTIATLYRVDGSSDNIYADVFKFRIKGVQSQMMFECAVAVNGLIAIDNRLTVTCDNDSIPNDTLEVFAPGLRTLQVTTGGVYSGIVLQIGMSLGVGILQETFDIEDMSGRESCWKLVPFSAVSTPPEDTAVMMPNEVSTFTEGSPDSIATEATIPFKSGLMTTLSIMNLPVPLSEANAAIVFTSETDLVAQNVGMISLDSIHAISISVVIDIGTTPIYTTIYVPIVSVDVLSKLLIGVVETMIGSSEYRVICRLRYAVDKYVLDFSVMKASGTSTSITINVTSVGISF